MKRRTQIYLDENIYQELKKIADRRDASISELIRERIGKPNEQKRFAGNGKQVLEVVEAMGKNWQWRSAPKNLSERVDEVLYGER